METNTMNTTPHALMIHEFRRADRLYRGLLGHEQDYLIGLAAHEFGRAEKQIQDSLATLGKYKTTRRLIKTARFMVMQYLKLQNDADV